MGKLYGVGVGPGDPELLTLKAIKIIQDADIIAVPKTEGKTILALSIVEAILDLSDKEILELYMPMTRDDGILKENHRKAAEELIFRLERGKTIAFLTLGDPSIYSTYSYLHRLVQEAGFEVQLVPGVPSFCAVAAKLNDPLCYGEEPLHIIPASYKGLGDYLDWKGTKVLMKTGKQFTQVKEGLAKKDLLTDSAMVVNCGMKDEKVYGNLSGLKEKDTPASYFTIVVVKDKDERKENQQ